MTPEEYTDLLTRGAVEIAKKKKASAAVADAMVLRGASLLAQTITDHEWILAGPADCSKTWGGLLRVAREARRVRGGRFAIVRKVREHMRDTVCPSWQTVIDMHGDFEKHGGSDPTHWTCIKTGTIVQRLGLDKAGRVLSGQYDGFFVNQAEELTEDEWALLASRCSGRGAVTDTPMIWGDCNPGPEEHWIRKRKSLRVEYAKHEDNPQLYDDAGNLTPGGVLRIAVLDNLTGIQKERLRYGRWVSAEGVVYPGFLPQNNVKGLDFLIERGIALEPRGDGGLRLNPEVVRNVFAGVDWGYTHPGAIIVGAVDGDGRLWIIHETHRSNRLLDWWVDEAKRLRDLYDISFFACDPSEPANIEAFKRAGLPAGKAINDAIGRQFLAKRLEVAGDGLARLIIWDSALAEVDDTLVKMHQPTGLVQEFGSYVLARRGDGSFAKEEPVNEKNDSADACKYLVAHADGLRGDLRGTAWLEMMNEQRIVPESQSPPAASAPAWQTITQVTGILDGMLAQSGLPTERPFTEEELKNVIVFRKRPDENP